MSKITTKLQVTIPKAIAERYRLKPGDEIEWVPSGECVRVVPVARERSGADDPEARVREFDRETERQREREASGRAPRPGATERGWARDDAYDRGVAR